MKHLSTARVFLAVPEVTRASVETSQFVEKVENVPGFDERVVMIGQQAPRNRAGGVIAKKIQQGCSEGVHAFGRESNVWRVFVTGRGDEEMEMPVVGTVWRSMPWSAIVLPPGQDLLPLLWRQLPPHIMRVGHDEKYGVPALAGHDVKTAHGI